MGSHAPDLDLRMHAHPPVRFRDECVTLTTHAVVHQSAFSNNCGIPVGGIIDFKPPESLQLPQISRQPNRCRSCAAYLNPYCKVNRSCHAGVSVMAPEIDPSCPHQINVEQKTWACSLCGQATSMSKDLDGQAPELSDEAVEYVFAAPQAVPQPRAHVVVAIDATASDEMLQGLSAGLIDALSAIDPDTCISVISFDSVVSLHSLDADASFSFTLPGRSPLDPALLAAYLDGNVGGAGGRKGQLMAVLKHSRPRLKAILNSLRPLESDKPLLQRARCLGVAMEAGLHLLSSSVAATSSMGPVRHLKRVARGSRLLVLTAGPATKGPGSVPLSALEAGAAYHERLSSSLSRDQRQQASAAQEFMAECVDLAKAHGIPIDVILGGDPGFVNAPLMSMVTKDTHGLLLQHEGFGACFGPALRACFSRCFGSSALLDCYVDEGLRLVQWMGPVSELQGPDPEDVGLAMASDRRLSNHACSIIRLQQGHGASVRLELQRDLNVPELVLQIVLQFIDHTIGGRLVQRVVTRRLKVVTKISDFLASVSPGATLVVMAKKAAVEAKKAGALWDAGKAEEFRYSMQAELSLIASRCGREVQVSRGIMGLGARKVRQWPPGLNAVALALYQLQRGGLLGPVANVASQDAARAQADRRLLFVNLLLSASSSIAQRMILPRLFHLEGGKLQEVPAVDLVARRYLAAPARAPPGVPPLDCGSSVVAVSSATEAGKLGKSTVDAAAEALAVRSHVLTSMSAAGGLPPQLRLESPASGLPQLLRLLPPGSRDALKDVDALHPGVATLLLDDKLPAQEPAHPGGQDEVSCIAWSRAAGVLLTKQIT